jgi:hypothetical protein
MLKQIRGHWYKPTYPFYFSDINYIDKKIDQIILEQVPCEEFYEKMAAILNKMEHYLRMAPFHSSYMEK